MPLDLYPDIDPTLDPVARAAELADAYEGRSPDTILRAALRRELPRGRTALVSSFGAESALLLARVAAIDPATPVLFLETGRHFPETLAYRDALIARLGLSDVRVVAPEPAEVAARDADAGLHARDADACCHMRKTAPLERTLAPFDAWITGRKRAQSSSRAAMRVFETDAAGRIKVNPLADWTAEDVAAAAARLGLPAHPLVARGFPSIGCAPCTSPVAAGEDPRAGRWRGSAKTECGIHVDADGRLRRAAA